MKRVLPVRGIVQAGSEVKIVSAPSVQSEQAHKYMTRSRAKLLRNKTYLMWPRESLKSTLVV